MQTAQKLLLKSIFQIKSNFAPGISPPRVQSENVEVTPFAGGAAAAGTISADFEHAWAFRSRSQAEYSELSACSRRNVPLIVRLLAEQDIPITWATVGHLFLDRCQRAHSGLAHPEMPRPPKNLRWEGDWYRHDPCTDRERDPHWYAPDLIALICASKTRHEIGSHSFSHIDFSADTSTSELVRSELEACIQVMAPHGLQLRSLVYPFNNMGHHYLDLIGSLGLTAVRHRDKRIKLSYPESTPHGVYKLCETMNFRRGRYYDYIDKARIFLEAACERNAAFHLWFHPSDPTEFFEREFQGIIRQMAALRREGKLWPATMGQLAAYCEARRRTTLDVRHEGKLTVVHIKCDYDAKRYGQTALTLRLASQSPPKQCQALGLGSPHPVAWKEQPAPSKQGSRSFLVDVPAGACELRVSF
jgi:peptidoglycan/xylan/chitin deacetylase (PgdA/CDA1 family)